MEKIFQLASNWMTITDSEVVSFKDAIAKFLNLKNSEFKCGITNLISKKGFTISVILPDSEIKLKLTQNGFSHFDKLDSKINSLILESKNTFVKDCDGQNSYNINEKNEKEYLCVGGSNFGNDINTLRMIAFDEIKYHYVRNFHKLPDRFILILDLETIELYDKDIKKGEFIKLTHSKEAYQKNGEVTCDICGCKCTDINGNLLSEFSYFYHCKFKSIDYCQKHQKQAEKGINLEYLRKIDSF